MWMNEWARKPTVHVPCAMTRMVRGRDGLREEASHPSVTFKETFIEDTILYMCEHFPHGEGESSVPCKI